MRNRKFRAKIIESLGASASASRELLEYNRNFFDHSALKRPLGLPLEDDPFVGVWQQYAAEAEEGSLFHSLQKRLVQLRFPIRKGISLTEPYRSAILKGISPDQISEATGLILKNPEALKLILHSGPAGRVPILISGERRDFETLIQALSARNEPEPVPPSMGALTVWGYNNWDRIRTLKEKWQDENPNDLLGMGWEETFQRIIPQKELYQDRFIILSEGPYSAVVAHAVALSPEKWQEISLMIRREHECTHYFTRRLFGSMKNRLLDELLADFMGITRAIGRFRADWFLLFMGLEDYPNYREGGRLQNYIGEPPLSREAFKVLQALAVSAAENLESIESKHREEMGTLSGRSFFLMALTYLTIEELASDEAVSLMGEALERAKRYASAD